ncbi:MAG TPA: class I SAM-dependent methyltransferase [Candidatus Paceibacterota bacterium]|jgi:trans-aconitate methyltransferase|nr:class I SAM-dependent methyltransferase [Candidatus Paceibacterota bacterium]
MKELPEAETYEEGLEYWPYRSSLAKVIDTICEKAPQGATLLDMMCGPGYLLGKIGKRRPDLKLTGVDIDERYVPYGQKTYPKAQFEKGDVLTWRPKELFDVVVCTGSVHHVPYDKQEAAVANMASMVKPGGFAIISDAYVDDYSNETERKQAAAKLGYEYIRETIANGGSDKVVEWTVDILWNDVLMHEFKTSFKKRLPILEKYFAKVETTKTWPNIESDYGDYVHICTPR